MDATLARIQNFTAEAARKFLESPQDPENALFRDVSSGLQTLLEWHWHSAGLWQYKWFDGIGEGTLKATSADTLFVSGMMVWGDSGNTSGPQWWDVFSADLRISGNPSVLAKYTLRFGRKGFEERRIYCDQPQQLRQELNDLASLKWAHVFIGN